MKYYFAATPVNVKCSDWGCRRSVFDCLCGWLFGYEGIVCLGVIGDW